MDKSFNTSEITPHILASVGDGDTRRQWHTPMLKELKVSTTLENRHHGLVYDSTYIRNGS
jgi:hypothetical protein